MAGAPPSSGAAVPTAPPAAVQNLATDAWDWSNETTVDINWDDPAGSAQIADALYTVDGSPTSGATVQTSPGDNEDLELSGLSDGIHQVWVWLHDAANQQDPSTAQQVTVYVDTTPPQIGAVSGVDYDADTISFPVSDSLSGMDPDSVDVEATNPNGSDDEDLDAEDDDGTIVVDLPDYADNGNQWTFAVSAADFADNDVTTSFNVTLHPPPPGSNGTTASKSAKGSKGQKGSKTPNAPHAPVSKTKMTVVVTGHNVYGHVPTNTAVPFSVYRVHGIQLKRLRHGRTSTTGSFSLHVRHQISGTFEARAGRYQAAFIIKKAK